MCTLLLDIFLIRNVSAGRPLVNLNEIRTFVTVARTGSIQAVAHDAVCGVTAVQRLEQDLGATLFDRQTKPWR